MMFHITLTVTEFICASDLGAYSSAFGVICGLIEVRLPKRLLNTLEVCEHIVS